MPKFFNATSFACGVFAVSVLVCAIGAARNAPSDGNKYDATQIITMDGLGIHIVDHDAETLYAYVRNEKDDVISYKLIEKVDLSASRKNNLHAGRIGGCGSLQIPIAIGTSLLMSVLQWCREQIQYNWTVARAHK